MLPLHIVVRVARLEMRLLSRSRTTLALAAAVGLLLVGATAAGLARDRSQRQQVQRYQSLVEAQWREQPDRHPHRVAHYGFLVFREPPPLAFADSGVMGFAGNSLFLEAHRQNLPNFAEAAVSPGAGRFGELTLASVLQLFLPLLLLVLSAVAITREREQGTLPLALSLGASWHTLAAGKWLGLLVAFALVVAPGAIAAGALLALASGGVVPEPSRLLLVLLATAAHLAAVTALGTALSARAASSRDALLVALGVWIALWVVVPRALPVAAARLWPLPARSVFEADVERSVRELGDSHDPNDPKFLAFRASLLGKHGVAAVEELPLNYQGLVMAEGERHTAEAYRMHFERIHTALRRHQALLSGAGLLSPYLALRDLSMAAAGASLDHELEFQRQAEAYRFDLVQRLNALHAARVPHALDRYSAGAEGATPSRMRIDRSHFQTLPRFSYAAPSLGWSLRGSWPGVAANLAWLAGSLALLAWAAASRRASA